MGLFRWVAVAAAFALTACAINTVAKPGQGTVKVGAAQAKGIIIFAPGWSSTDPGASDDTIVPHYIRDLNRRGWDVVRANISSFDQENGLLHHRSREVGDNLVAMASSFKKEGYKTVVVAGQSFGSWSILDAAPPPGLVDGIIAVAPAAYGTGSNKPLNSERFYPILENMSQTPVMLVFFSDDAYESDRRDVRSERILTVKNIPHHIIGYPDGHLSHHGAWRSAFSYAYGECLEAFVNNPAAVSRLTCIPAPRNPTDFRWMTLERHLKSAGVTVAAGDAVMAAMNANRYVVADRNGNGAALKTVNGDYTLAPESGANAGKEQRGTWAVQPDDTLCRKPSGVSAQICRKFYAWPVKGKGQPDFVSVDASGSIIDRYFRAAP